MQTIEEMASFVKLWDLVQQVQLTNESDRISWRWTADGTYNAKSAYVVQFTGSYNNFSGTSIWKAETEGKHKFFAWLLLQCKILTTDKLIARQWPCNPVCVLCNQEQKTAAHLILHCHFAHSVWQKVQDWTEQLVQVPTGNSEIVDWWQKRISTLT